MHFFQADDFTQWRKQARNALQRQWSPAEVDWRDLSRGMLFGAKTEVPRSSHAESEQVSAAVAEGERDNSPAIRVPKVPERFLKLAKTVSCHRDESRWNRLYRVLWRLTHGEPHLLAVSTDDDVRQLELMQKAVSRDAHKTKAFVRFRRVEQNDTEHFIAWHRPDHRVLPLVAPFFSRRFPSMHWTILTPDESVSWDLNRLHFGPGVSADQAPPADVLEDLWRTYYAHIFNPARIKLKTMTREMPRRHWSTLPEAKIIEDLLDEAPRRVEQMIARQEGFAESAVDYFPDEFTLAAFAQAAKGCQACSLHASATQTVFGQGPGEARVMLIGEQPGDEEDHRGEPFVGPAGRMLRECLQSADVAVEDVYLTNAVKHFKFTPAGSGKRRLHQKPDAREVSACKPWLAAEAELIKPSVVVCLGVTAMQTVIGPGQKLTDIRGQWRPSPFAEQTLATWHPAAILRQPDRNRQQAMRSELICDLKKAREGSST